MYSFLTDWIMWRFEKIVQFSLFSFHPQMLWVQAELPLTHNSSFNFQNWWGGMGSSSCAEACLGREHQNDTQSSLGLPFLFILSGRTISFRRVRLLEPHWDSHREHWKMCNFCVGESEGVWILVCSCQETLYDAGANHFSPSFKFRLITISILQRDSIQTSGKENNIHKSKICFILVS